MTDLTPDQTLALAYVPAPRREGLRALWQLDARLGEAAVTAREPMIRRIKLAWWREALERLDQAPPPAEPILTALAAHVLPAGISGAELSLLEEGWAHVADDLESTNIHDYAASRGATLFALSARLLGRDWPPVQPAGALWALADLVNRGGKGALPPSVPHLPEQRWPSALRPLGMLAILAARDLAHGPQSQGSPSRMLRMLRHRLTGR